MLQRPGIEELEAMRRMREEYLRRKGGKRPAGKKTSPAHVAAQPTLPGLPEVMLREPTNDGLPTEYVPSEKELLEYLHKWDTLNVYMAHEQALQMLFRSHGEMSTSTDLLQVIIKCSVLNDFYSTNIYQVEPVARHIAGIPDIDGMLERSEP